MPENNIESETRHVVEGDYWDEVVEIPTTFAGDISGYTNWKCLMMSSDVLTADVSAASVSGSVSVLSNANRTVEIVADDSLTDELVADGSTSTKLYSDLRAEVEAGKPQTLKRLQWDVARKYRISS